MSEQQGEIWAIIPAAGESKRFKNHPDKLLVDVGGIPMLVRTTEGILDCPSVTGAIVVAQEDRIPRYHQILDQFGHAKPIKMAKGGLHRRQSVYNGLKALPKTASIVLIHDAARPLFDRNTVEEAIDCIKKGGRAAILAFSAVDTIKETHLNSNTIISKTLDRRTIWQAQTPQVFEKELIVKAHEMVGENMPVTDDAQLLELTSLAPVNLIKSSQRNLKITTEDDWHMAQALYQAGKKSHARSR